MKRYLTLTALIMVLGVAGCGFNLWEFLGVEDGDEGVARLQRFSSEAELKAYLTDQAGLAYQFAPSPEPSPDDGDVDTVSGDNGDSSAPTSPGLSEESGGGDGDRDYSTTTEQEEGVQEGDVIKNDGEYIYVLSRGVLRIVHAVPADAMTEVGSVDLDGYGYELYLVDDRVVAITTPNAPVIVDDGAAVTSELVGPDYYYRPQTEITVIGVADRANPTVLSRAVVDGSIATSRMIANRLHLVAVNYPDIFMARFSDDGGGMNLEDVSVNDIIPDILIEENGSVVYNGDVTDFANHYRPADPDGLGMTTVISMDIDALRGFDAQSLVGYPANIYASTEALYVTDTDYNWEGNLRETTDVYKFAFSESGLELVAAGSVPGRVLNQYSMSEHNGFLRVATTVGNNFMPIDEDGGEAQSSSNNVYVLEQAGDALTTVGSVQGLAPGESIYSARFIGDKGYLVTFEQIDPLFTLDLSDPRNPRAVGELKVPGFSTFIMPMGPNHLLTIGQDTNDEFGFTFAQGIRLSIFDVSDFAAPRLAHFEVIGTNGAYSEALYNPKAFTYFAAQNLVAIPVEEYNYGIMEGDFADDDSGREDGVSEGDSGEGDSGEGDSEEGDSGAGDGEDGLDLPVTGDDPTGTDVPPAPGIFPPVPQDFFMGIYVYRVTVDGGFEQLGRISTAGEDGGYYFYGWEFTRGAFIGETVYAVTGNGVQSAAIANLANILSRVDFPLPEWAFPDDVVLPEPMPTEPTVDPADDSASSDGDI